MIVVTVDLHKASSGEVETLGKMVIANTGEGTDLRRGDYRVRVARKNDVRFHPRMWGKPTRVGRVEGYPRLSYSVWRLVARALLSAFPEENSERKRGSTGAVS